MVRSFVALIAALVLLPAATATAQTCVAPPGTAAIDQYCETVPAAGGDRGSTDAGPRVAIPQQTADQLARSNEGGTLLRNLGNDPKKPWGATKQRAGSDESEAPVAPSNNPLDAVGSALSSGPTLDGWFIAALLAVTLLMVSWGWIAYRRRDN